MTEEDLGIYVQLFLKKSASSFFLFTKFLFLYVGTLSNDFLVTVVREMLQSCGGKVLVTEHMADVGKSITDLVSMNIFDFIQY